MKHKLLVLLGTTSTGKTDLALSLAQKLNGELVSADSRQVYKYLDIGTGKEVAVRYQVLKGEGYWIVNGIKIWLYDVVSPAVRFDLHRYVLKASQIINNISDRKKLPILVGGTGLYIRSLLEGVSDFGTGENHSLRQELEKMEISQIEEKINKQDFEVLKKLNNSEIHNKRRLIRLLEKLTAPKKDKESFPGINNNFDILKIGLKTARKALRQRIEKRVLLRIDQGMIEESKKLLGEKILTYQRMEELGLEYKYIAAFLKGEIQTLDEFIEILSLKIGQFAKRQETWFRKEKAVVWFDISAADFEEQVEKQILDWYNNKNSNE